MHAKQHIKGTIFYIQRMALPKDAQVEVRLMDDVSLAERKINVIAEQVYLASGMQVPLPFDIEVDMERIDAGRQYAIDAWIEDGLENLIFKNDGMQFVDVHQHPTEAVNIRLETVR